MSRKIYKEIGGKGSIVTTEFIEDKVKITLEIDKSYYDNFTKKAKGEKTEEEELILSAIKRSSANCKNYL